MKKIVKKIVSEINSSSFISLDYKRNQTLATNSNFLNESLQPDVVIL